MTNLPNITSRILLIPTQGDMNRLKQVMGYWKVLAEQNLVGWAFPANDIVDANDFAEMMINDKTIQGFLVCDTRNDNHIVAHFHLNGFQGLIAHAHFSMLRGPNHISIARAAIKQLFLSRRTGELPFVEALIGVTPLYNKAACRFIKCMGFKEQFVAPSASYIAKEDKYSDALITMVKREDTV